MSLCLYRLVIQPEAEEEVAEAAQWYEAREPGLGREFLRAFRAVIAVLRRTPFHYQVLQADARRVIMRRFPYMIIYEIHDTVVVVHACFHTARDPREWQERIGSRDDSAG